VVKPNILIVDDDAATRGTLAELVAMQGFEVASVGDLEAARRAIADSPPNVVLTDLVMPGGSGLDVLRDFDGPSRPELIMITGHASVDSAVEALRAGALDYLTKPVDVPRLKTILANVQRTLALKAEVSDLRGELRRLGRFGSMIGSSPMMQRVYDRISKVAPTEATVLVTGESGTGKELVAQTVHELSARRDGPFVPVNCGAVPANLIESQLFGHERGSFTGATQQHRGLFEQASSGTLFLDEITEMPAELQARLLRVLETGQVVRIGGEQPLAVNVRVVAATNRSPEAAVREGVLRNDLYYRLNVFPIELPPLRERQGDIEQLAEHFLAQLNQAEGTSKVFGPGARRTLAQRAWSGNVRELKNAVQRAFIMGDDTVDLEDGGVSMPSPSGAPSDEDAIEGVRLGMPIRDVERRVILATLERCGGDKRKAAEMLGISLKTLYNRLSVYRGQPAEA
jgi:two-component system response regulator AtoC